MTFWIVSGAFAGGGDAAKGKGTYDTYCTSCHGATGKGDGAAAAALNPKPRDLTDKAYIGKLDDKYLFEIISKGGAAIGKSALMPPWGGSLTEADIRNIVAYIRSLVK
jgi:mono/diheme cytochrome c family protein